MTQVIVNQILDQLETLGTEELQQLQQSIQAKLSHHQTVQQADFLKALLASGLVQQVKDPASRQSIKRQLIEIQGKSLSETILEECR
jgi:DNA-binding transcriptional regulator/RsmH inhibitor MraZ